jgi:hypothetical protein
MGETIKAVLLEATAVGRIRKTTKEGMGETIKAVLLEATAVGRIKKTIKEGMVETIEAVLPGATAVGRVKKTADTKEIMIEMMSTTLLEVLLVGIIKERGDMTRRMNPPINSPMQETPMRSLEEVGTNRKPPANIQIHRVGEASLRTTNRDPVIPIKRNSETTIPRRM